MIYFFVFDRHGYLDATSMIIGYARSALTRDTLKDRLLPYLKSAKKNGNSENEDEKMKEAEKLDQFLSMCQYVQGGYDDLKGYEKVAALLESHENALLNASTEGRTNFTRMLRVFYLALPPSVFLAASQGIHSVLMQSPSSKASGSSGIAFGNSSCRIIVEKPFGRNLETSNELGRHLASLFEESQVKYLS